MVNIGSSLAHLTIDQAIITVLTEARPDDIHVRDIERRMTARGKKVAGGIIAHLALLMSRGRVRSTRRGYYMTREPAPTVRPRRG